ncbi:MAG: hypothetical protein COA36_16855 [Desulfotalea sp.]|nr:MAG: hypothetical protein COA36_16855 [Desulfotalea sp.]
MIQEEWKDVVGYEGLYLVSRIGIIKSLDRYVNNVHGSKTLRKGRVLKQHKNRKGYIQVKLCDNANHKSFRVHRLVADAFLPNLSIDPKVNQVNHINGIKDDNNYLNLEWCTNQENVIHAYANNLITLTKGEKHHNSKISDIDLLDVRDMISKEFTLESIAVKYKVSITAIWLIKKGINRKQ